MSGVPLATVGKLLGHKQARSTERYAHLANDFVRQGLEQATDRIVEAATPVAALPPAPFVPMSNAQWKAITAIVESTRGTCGGTRTDVRRTVDGIRWVLHHGAKWRELPAEYGKATTVWRWYERLCGDGTWQQIAASLARVPSYGPLQRGGIYAGPAGSDTTVTAVQRLHLKIATTGLVLNVCVW